MAGIVILVMLALLGAAAALRLGRVFLQRSADRAAARAADASASSAADAAEQAAATARHRAHPDWLVTVQSTLLGARIHPLEQRRGQLVTERDGIKAALDAQPAGPALVRKLLGYAALVLLPLLFLLSVYQLVPSFQTLSGSAPLAFAGGLLVAAIEVGMAFALARILYHGHEAAAEPGDATAPSDAPLADRLLTLADSAPAWSRSSLVGAVTLVAAGLLVWGQYSWAPAHDVIPLQSTLSIARETYAQDLQDSKQASLLTSDQQQVDMVSTRLTEVRERDEALALLVPLGEDAAALPALGALGFAAEDLRRQRRRHRLTGLNRQIGALDGQITQAKDDITLALQQLFLDLDIDPARATQSSPPSIAGGPVRALPPAAATAPPSPAPPVPAPSPGPAPATPPATGAPVMIEDLFPDPAGPAPGPEAEADNDRRWSDPL
jgi:hypothetical protein